MCYLETWLVSSYQIRHKYVPEWYQITKLGSSMAGVVSNYQSRHKYVTEREHNRCGEDNKVPNRQQCADYDTTLCDNNVVKSINFL